ncbi:MAG: response regulator [Deltaproteobacteria bacterium]|nr:response regulator [Deltaproteobacteria bacterium]
MAIAEWIRLEKNLALQITSRSRLRQELEKYLDGQLNAAELKLFSAPKLDDAMAISKEIIGITRLDVHGRIVAQVGTTFPQSQWPSLDFIKDNNAALSTPFAMRNDARIIVGAKISNRKERHLGYDLVMLDVQHLKAIVGDVSGLGMDAKIILAYSVDNHIHSMFPRAEGNNNGRSREPLNNNMQLNLNSAIRGKSGLALENKIIMAYWPVKGTNWGLLITRSTDALYGDLNKSLAGMIGMCFIGFIVCLAGFGVILKPLSSRIILRTEKLESTIEERTRQRDILMHSMEERVKELRCLHGTADSVRKRTELKDAFQDVSALLPPSWHYPEIARGRIHFDGRDFFSEPFESTRWSLISNITVNGKQRGFVEVCYLEQRPNFHEGPFLKEERQLIDNIALTLSEAAEHKQAEEERSRLTAAIKQADEVIMITDTDGKIVYANPAFKNATGFSLTEALGKNPSILKSGKQSNYFYQGLWNTITNGGTWRGHFVNKKKDGSLYDEEASISPVRNATGEIINYVAVKRDISWEIQMQAQLQQSQKMEAIGTLAGGIAHDFNNILGIIMGYTEISFESLAEGVPAKNNLKEVLTAASRAKDLINHILDFSRQSDPTIRPVSIKPVINETIKFLRSTLPTTIEINQHIQADPDTVMSDPTQIHQVMMNLCTNAKHAMTANGGVLNISLTEEDHAASETSFHADLRPGKYLKLAVSDNGCGMDPAVMEKIFNPFFTTKEQGQGTGLGLSAVHGIVKRCGGNITVESEPGKGTAFFVYLPLAENKSPLPETLPTGQITGGTEHVLLVDDEQMNISFTRKILEQLGYRVTARTSSIEALEAFRNMPDKFDLIITDQTMPNLTGADMAKEMLLIRPPIPIILCTGFSELISESQALSMGISEYVTKPIVRAQLAMTIRKALDKS